MFDFIINFIQGLSPGVKFVSVYIIGYVVFCFIASLFGDDSEEAIDIGCICIFWPLLLPFILLIIFICIPSWLAKWVKNKYIEKKQEKDSWEDM